MKMPTSPLALPIALLPALLLFSCGQGEMWTAPADGGPFSVADCQRLNLDDECDLLTLQEIAAEHYIGDSSVGASSLGEELSSDAGVSSALPQSSGISLSSAVALSSLPIVSSPIGISSTPASSALPASSIATASSVASASSAVGTSSSAASGGLCAGKTACVAKTWAAPYNMGDQCTQDGHLWEASQQLIAIPPGGWVGAWIDRGAC